MRKLYNFYSLLKSSENLCFLISGRNRSRLIHLNSFISIKIWQRTHWLGSSKFPFGTRNYKDWNSTQFLAQEIQTNVVCGLVINFNKLLTHLYVLQFYVSNHSEFLSIRKMLGVMIIYYRSSIVSKFVKVSPKYLKTSISVKTHNSPKYSLSQSKT